MEVLLQMVQKLGHQEQLIPGALLVPQQVTKHRIKLTNAQILTVLDSAISITSKEGKHKLDHRTATVDEIKSFLDGHVKLRYNEITARVEYLNEEGA